MGLVRALDGDTVGDRVAHLMAESELQHQILALELGAVSDAVDLQVAGEALGDAGDQVVDDAARRAPHLLGAVAVVPGPDHDLVAVALHLHLFHQRQVKLAELALGGDLPAGDFHRDAVGNGDRMLADA